MRTVGVRRLGWLRLLASPLASLPLAVLPPAARAADDCGPPSAGLVTCDAASETGGGYQDADGITYGEPGLTIRHLGDGVAPTEHINLVSTGNLAVISSGAISQTAISTAADRAGIFVISGGGTVEVTTTGAGTVATTGDSMHGIYGLGFVEVTLTAGAAVITQGKDAAGIFGTSFGGPVAITSAAVTTGGVNSAALVARTLGSGNVSVTANGLLRTTGVGSKGVYAESAGGTVTVRTQAVETTQSGSSGIAALTSGLGEAGTIEVTALGTISTLRDTSLGVQAKGGGDITVRTRAVTTQGDFATAIAAQSDLMDAVGDVHVVVDGQIGTLGRYSTGILAQAAGGSVTIEAGVVDTLGENALGIHALSSFTLPGAGVSITATDVSTRGEGALGVVGQGSGDIEIALRSLTTQGGGAYGLGAVSFGAGTTVDVAIERGVSTQGDDAWGVYAEQLGGTGAASVTVEVGGAITTQGQNSAGIIAKTGSGAVAVTALGGISTQGDGAAGIITRAHNGSTTIEAGRIETSGVGAMGISAELTGTLPGALLAITAAEVHTLEDGAFGVQASSAGGIDLAIGRVSTKGDFATGVIGQGAGTVEIAVDSAATEGEIAFGVAGRSSGVGASVSLAVTGAVSTQGGNSYAVFAEQTALTGQGLVTVQVTGPVTTAGFGATGIVAKSASGAVAVTGGAVTTTGEQARGIHAINEGADSAATITVLAQGLVRTSGVAAYGVLAEANGGEAQVEARSVVASGQDAVAVFSYSALAAGNAVVAGAQGGWDAAAAGVVFGSGTAGVASTLTVIAGEGVGALNDIAIRGSDNGDNSVRVRGLVVGQSFFGSGDDQLTIERGGRYLLRNFRDLDGDGLRDEQSLATLDFRGGNDSLTIEAGGVLALADTPELFEAGRTKDLEILRNAGLITLSDSFHGAAPEVRDVLVTFSDYVGLDGRLQLDVGLTAGMVPDRFLVRGDASGTTLVGITRAQGAGGATGSGSADGFSLVQVLGNAEADSFQLTGPSVYGAWQYRLVAFDPASADPGALDPYLDNMLDTDFWDYRLQSVFFEGVHEYPTLLLGANLLGQAALGAALGRPEAPPAIAAPATARRGQVAALGLADMQEAARATAGDGLATGGWLAAFGEGLAVSPGAGADFDQDSYGLQAGYDLLGWRGLLDGEDSLRLGALATLAEARLDYGASGSEATISLYGGGLYAAYDRGGLSLDLAAQLLTGSTRFTAPAASIEADLDTTTLGLGAAVAWRLDLGQLFLRPGAELGYLRSWGEGFDDGLGAAIDLDDSRSLVARGAVTAGLRLDSLEPYLSLGVAHEFLGEADATVSGIGFDATTRGTTYEVGGGLTAWALAANLSLTLDATYRFGEEVEGLSVTGGLKLSW